MRGLEVIFGYVDVDEQLVNLHLFAAMRTCVAHYALALFLDQRNGYIARRMGVALLVHHLEAVDFLVVLPTLPHLLAQLPLLSEVLQLFRLGQFQQIRVAVFVLQVVAFVGDTRLHVLASLLVHIRVEALINRLAMVSVIHVLHLGVLGNAVDVLQLFDDLELLLVVFHLDRDRVVLFEIDVKPLRLMASIHLDRFLRLLDDVHQLILGQAFV